MANQRLDQALVARGLAPSRTKAKELIQSGSVEAMISGTWRVVTQPSFSVAEGVELRCNDSELLKYVSRSGLKLEGALRDSSFSVLGMRALDIGQSTGGFSECLLMHGAEEVVGVEVGKDQLHQSLFDREGLVAFEGLNIKDVSNHKWFVDKAEYFDLIVCDVSFISVQMALPPALFLLKPGGSMFLLVKPQFELGKKALNKKGLVTDPNLSETIHAICKTWSSDIGIEVLGFYESQIKGQDGNQEFILYAKKPT